MTIPVSVVPAACSYLLTAIESACSADPLFPEMLIELGEPTQDLENDIIAVGRVVRSEQPRTLVGSGAQFWLNESFDIDVNINTWLGSGDADNTSADALALNARAWQLVGYVETAVRNDPSFGGLVNEAFPRMTDSTGPVWSDSPAGGQAVGITMQIHVENLN